MTMEFTIKSQRIKEVLSYTLASDVCQHPTVEPKNRKKEKNLATSKGLEPCYST